MGVKLSPLLLQFPAPDCMPSRWLSSKVKSSVHQSRDSARVLLASSLRIILIPFREQIVDFHVSVNTHISYAENPVRPRRQWPHPSMTLQEPRGSSRWLWPKLFPKAWGTAFPMTPSFMAMFGLDGWRPAAEAGGSFEGVRPPTHRPQSLQGTNQHPQPGRLLNCWWGFLTGINFPWDN